MCIRDRNNELNRYELVYLEEKETGEYIPHNAEDYIRDGAVEIPKGKFDKENYAVYAGEADEIRYYISDENLDYYAVQDSCDSNGKHTDESRENFCRDIGAVELRDTGNSEYEIIFPTEGTKTETIRLTGDDIFDYLSAIELDEKTTEKINDDEWILEITLNHTEKIATYCFCDRYNTAYTTDVYDDYAGVIEYFADTKINGHPCKIEFDENGYFAKCIDIDGCFTQGETYEEVLKNLTDAITLHEEETKQKYVVIDKDNYCQIIEATTEENAIRECDNLESFADLRFAKSRVWGIYGKDITDEMIEEHECATVMSHGHECRCGQHQD